MSRGPVEADGGHDAQGDEGPAVPRRVVREVDHADYDRSGEDGQEQPGDRADPARVGRSTRVDHRPDVRDARNADLVHTADLRGQ
jgi:hypothetical protein